jgi:hypothetical protein
MFRRDTVLEIDRGNGTFSHACRAADALVWIDEHLDPREALSTFGFGNRTNLIDGNWSHDAVDWADVDANGVAGPGAFLGDHVGHAGDRSTRRAVVNYLKLRADR